MSKTEMATILGGLAMVCGTVVSCFYISRKDNMKIVNKIYEPVNRLVDICDRYVEHDLKVEDDFRKDMNEK